MRATIARSIQAHLERLNSEFKNYAPAEYRTPRVTLHTTGDPEWFPPGVKHRYTRR
jgi:phenylacetate-CoA ligase